MADAGVAEVEEAVAWAVVAGLDEDVAVMEVIVDEGIGRAEGGQFFA